MVVLKFETIKPKNHIKTQNKQGYSITYLPESNSLLLYGVLTNSDVYSFSLMKKQWTLIETFGKKPSFRRFYAHYYHKGLNGLIIHGGQIVEKQKKPSSSDECYILFVDSWQWRKIFLTESPSERQFHQFFQNKDKQNDEIFLFGGFAKHCDAFLNDVWSFRNIGTLSTKTKHEVHGCSSRMIHTKGQAPYIYGYSVKVIDGKAMFIGGQNFQQKKSLQIYILCLKNFIWQRLDIANRVCPSLMCFGVYESGIDSEKFYIMGGLIPYASKSNNKCYSLNLREMSIMEEQKFYPPDTIFHTCLITQSPLCISSIQHSTSQDQPQIHIFYEQQTSLSVSKHFQTDQIYESTEPISIEQYLKAIKHEQVLSQEIIKKNVVLEELYKEIQRYIAVLYTRYLNDQQTPTNQLIEQQKQLNINSCEQLKQDYMENAEQFEQILKNIKKLRADLGMIHEDFQRCIETQIDEEQN